MASIIIKPQTHHPLNLTDLHVRTQKAHRNKCFFFRPRKCIGELNIVVVLRELHVVNLERERDDSVFNTQRGELQTKLCSRTRPFAIQIKPPVHLSLMSDDLC